MILVSEISCGINWNELWVLRENSRSEKSIFNFIFSKDIGVLIFKKVLLSLNISRSNVK